MKNLIRKGTVCILIALITLTAINNIISEGYKKEVKENVNDKSANLEHLCGCKNKTISPGYTKDNNTNTTYRSAEEIENELVEIRKAIEKSNANWTAGYNSIFNLSYKEKMARCIDIPDVYEFTKETKETKYEGMIPPVFDWRDVNGTDWTTSIKDQDGLGSCWSFAVIASFESVIQIYEDVISHPDLSEAHLFFCCRTDYLHYLKEFGVPDEGCFPYSLGLRTHSCSTCWDWEERARKIARYDAVSSNITSIQAALLKYGPLPAVMVVYADFHSYNGGVYQHVYGSKIGNHGVTIVGYNDNAKYWICKNSWGRNWGENGWFRIKYGECGIGSLGVVYLSLNHCPRIPRNPFPGNGTGNLDVNVDLSWDGGDLDNDTVYYDVYFKKGEPPTEDDIVSYHQTNTTYDPGVLEKDATYFWRIIATDSRDDSTEGPVWYFQTEDLTPPNITILNPRPGYLYKDGGSTIKQVPFPWAAIVIGNITIEVSAWDNNSGMNRVEIYVDNILKSTLYDTPYEWFWDENKFGRCSLRIIAYDNAGNAATDETKVWMFNS